jgi:quercetin dioxygenase-like cupin family protein
MAAVVAAGLVSAAATFGQAGHGPAPAVKWGPAPPFFAAGARFAVLQGDPSASGEYTVRLEFPAGYVIKPHFHPTDENVTVLSGSFLVGMGDSVDAAQGMVLGAGGFITAPAQAHHFAEARRKTVVQVHGMGPFAITYVRASDDPRTVTSSR